MNTTQYLKVELQNPNSGSVIQLIYEIFDHAVARAWANLLKKQCEKKHEIYTTFYGTNFYSKEEILNTFRHSLKVLNTYGRHSIDLHLHENLTQREINKIHEWYEELQVHSEYSLEVAGPEVRKALFFLNSACHRYEKFFGENTTHEITIEFSPCLREDLANEHYRLFSTQRSYGGLSLSYGTLGVSYIDCFERHTERPPVPQTTYTAGINLWLGKNQDYEKKEELDSWLQMNYGTNISDPKLSLGLIPLGRIIDPLISRKELLQKISIHNSVKSLELLTASMAEVFSSRPERISLSFTTNSNAGTKGRIVFSLYEKKNAIALLNDSDFHISLFKNEEHGGKLLKLEPPKNYEFASETISGAQTDSLTGVYKIRGSKDLYIISNMPTQEMSAFSALDHLSRVGDVIYMAGTTLLENQTSIHAHHSDAHRHPDARWPSIDEINLHLKFKPYLALGISFDFASCLSEAKTYCLFLLLIEKVHRFKTEMVGDGRA